MHAVGPPSPSPGIHARGKRGTAALLLLAVSLSAGCGTLPSGRRWGEDAYRTSLGRVGAAARDALLDPATLVPLAGAAVFLIDGDLDERASDWATEHRPVFGSGRAAEDWSDHLLHALAAEALVTALATPSGDGGEWLWNKGKGILGVEVPAILLVSGAAQISKDATNRARPEGSSESSFPSGHATTAFSTATLSNRNLESLEMPGGLRLGLQAGNYLLASSVAWARVEGGRHYPSDVLVGAALGHFLTAFLHDAFLGLPIVEDLEVLVGVDGDEWMVGLTWSP
jgi:hypothetical protein